MPIELREENGGKILEVGLVGTLVKEDYPPLIGEFHRLVALQGKIRVLLDMSRFHGWDAGALWEEIKFDLQHLNEMERLAVIGDKKWQHAIARFAEAVLPTATRYFDEADAAQARAWVAEP